jgi:TonB family C-terminal domain
MFTTLVESRAARSRRIGGTVVSAVIHGGLIAAAVLLTLPQRGDATPKPTPPEVFWVPLPHHDAPAAPQTTSSGSKTNAGPQIQAPHLSFDPGDIKPVDIQTGPLVPEPDALGRGGIPSTNPFAGGGTTGLGGAGGAWESNQVDRSPAVLGKALEPRYPAPLHSAGIEGRVIVQFVVDTLGRAEPAEITVMQTSHPAFADAVLEILPRYRFTPGEAAGRKVRTRVQMPFEFTLTR